MYIATASAFNKTSGRSLRTRVRRHSLRAAGTRHRQLPRQPISCREASGHPERSGTRPRISQKEGPDSPTHWEQGARNKSQYHGRSSSQVGAETSSQTPGRRDEAKEGESGPHPKKKKKTAAKAKAGKKAPTKKNWRRESIKENIFS